MCGLIYCNFIPENISISDINYRGPDFQKQIINDLGYFYHSTLSTKVNCDTQPYVSDNGILLYNGTEYTMQENDTGHIGNNLSDSFDNNLHFLKTLNGDYSIIFVTDKNVYCARDWIGTKPLYFSSKDNNFILSSTEYAISSTNLYPIKLNPNTLYKFNKKTGQLVKKQEIVKFNYTNQNTNNFDEICEQFETSVLNRFNTNNTLINLSSGYDSGAIAACLVKYKKNFPVAYFLQNESTEIIKQRTNLISGKKYLIKSNYISSNLYNELNYIDDQALKNPNIFVAHNSSLFAKKLEIRTILSGTGADELFADYGFSGKKLLHYSIFGGYFPQQLEIIEDWYLEYKNLTQSIKYVDYVTSYNGIDVRHPFLDKTLFQKFLNLSHHLKNNFYKSWIRQYLIETKFPFSENEKVALGESNKNITTKI